MRSNFRKFQVSPENVEIFSACLAQIAYSVNPNIDEVEAFEMACQRLRQGSLSYVDAVELGIMFLTTAPQPHTVWN